MTTVRPLAPRQRGPHVWHGHDLAGSSEWIWQLTNAQVDELRSAAAPLMASEAQLQDVTADLFVLPTLGRSLYRLRETLLHGRGFELIRGFPVHEVSEQEASMIFLGLGAYLGSHRSQNAAGDLLGHVRDVGADATDPSVRIYQTSERQTFHTDSSDVVGLMMLESAATGGLSMLASAAAIYNEMLVRDPALAACLFDVVATDRRGEVPEGQQPWFEIPVLNWFDDALTVIYQRQYIESAHRFEDAPPLSPTMVQALDLFDEITNDPAFHLTMELEPGDMQFVHNHALLHDRTAFSNKPGSPRHLLRLWLSLPGDRELPECFTQRYGPITVGDRGGIITRD